MACSCLDMNFRRDQLENIATWWWWQMMLLIVCCSIRSQQEFQSMMVLSNPGTQFEPLSEAAQLLSKVILPSFQACAAACNTNTQCRVFDFSVNLNQECRLFEGDLNTTGTIIASLSPTSRVGTVQLSADRFSSYGLPCSSGCPLSRYLMCGVNSTCQCMPHTYWNSFNSMCEAQSPLPSASCQTNMTMCRTDLNLTCLQFFECGPVSVLSGTSMFNNASLIPGTSTPALTYIGSVMTREINGKSAIFYCELSTNQIMSFFDRITAIDNLTMVTNNFSSGDSISNPSYTFLDVSKGNNLYVSDENKHRVILFTAMQNVNPPPRIVAGVSGTNGPSLNFLDSPIGIAVDNQSRIYICENYNYRVTRWAPNATSGVLIAGNSTQGSSALQLKWPTGLVLDEINSWLYVSDYGNHRIQRYKLDGNYPANGITVAGGNGYGSGSNQLYRPQGIWVSPKTGTLYIADYYNHRIQRWKQGAQSGVTVAGSPYGNTGSNATTIRLPIGIAVDANETFMYVGEYGNSRLLRFQVL